MIIENISQLPKMQRIIGLDLGEKTIGVAISDIMQTIASPMKTIKRRKFTLDANVIFELVAQNKVAAVIIGLPINMDGTEGARCQSTRQFGRNLLKIQDVPIFYQDERMSSQAVERGMDLMAMTHTRQKELVDKLAASYILQGVLDQLRTARK